MSSVCACLWDMCSASLLAESEAAGHLSPWDGDHRSPDAVGWGPAAGQDRSPGLELLKAVATLNIPYSLCDCFHLPIFCFSRIKFITFCILQFYFQKYIFIMKNLSCYDFVRGPVRDSEWKLLRVRECQLCHTPCKCCSHSVIRRKWLS